MQAQAHAARGGRAQQLERLYRRDACKVKGWISISRQGLLAAATTSSGAHSQHQADR